MPERTLFRAIQRGSDWNELKKIIKSHPNIHTARDDNGKTVLHAAAEAGNLPLVLLLLANKKVCNFKYIYKSKPTKVKLDRHKCGRWSRLDNSSWSSK